MQRHALDSTCMYSSGVSPSPPLSIVGFTTFAQQLPGMLTLQNALIAAVESQSPAQPHCIASRLNSSRKQNMQIIHTHTHTLSSLPRLVFVQYMFLDRWQYGSKTAGCCNLCMADLHWTRASDSFPG